ncbi:MAG: RNA-directed DNA polymerase, partial [Candidatus Peribacteria bacterium]|nr:RNA-directed DNA polymerase [Candidatus Peribacteria bacterium]
MDARTHKRNTHNQLVFEYGLETYLIELYQELLSGSYEIGKSIYFIQKHPIKREIFAGSFRDRIVHHLIYNYIAPIFEKTFIYDSYSCRVGKGTSMGIKRVAKFIRSCSENYTKDCYILKLDIQGYFMAID